MSGLATIIFLLIISMLDPIQAGHENHHRVIIHVPYKIKHIHHTRTIIKHVHHKDDGDKYELLGYTIGHPIPFTHGNELGTGHDYSEGHDLGGSDSGGGGHDFASYGIHSLGESSGGSAGIHGGWASGGGRGGGGWNSGGYGH